VLRFWNNEVLGNTSAVMQIIADTMSLDPSPGTPLRGAQPSPTRGEGKKEQ
jgi:hypothetical protein